MAREKGNDEGAREIGNDRGARESWRERKEMTERLESHGGSWAREKENDRGAQESISERMQASRSNVNPGRERHAEESESQ